MLFTYLMAKPFTWVLPWAIQAITYYFLLKKMDLRKWTCLIPPLADREFSKILFKRMSNFYRPFLVSVVFLIAAYYLGRSEETSLLYLVAVFIIYGIFLLRLHYRLARSFGKGRFFSVLTALIPTLFLLIIGLGRSRFTRPVFKQIARSKAGIWLSRAINGLITVAEVAVVILAVGFWTVRTLPPRPLANYLLNDVYEKTGNLEVTGEECLTREETMGSDAELIDSLPVSRGYFAPDHSGDKNVVVMEYIIGSNLENTTGLATANIRMMQDATKQGDALTFVLEAGGSGRWFTDGIEDGTYGRYTVSGGKVECAELLPDDLCMTEPKALLDFITWAKKTYPADRYMLVLWDHGGGVPSGFGQDSLNDRTDTEDYSSMRVSEIVDAIKKSGVTFDVIGFDACLMQNIETAKALEPYADYYLASEETEGGYGWYYTAGFGQLARDPGLSSEAFGRSMIASYDVFNTALNDGTPDTLGTLSFVDLTRIRPAAEQLDAIYEKAHAAILKDSEDYAEIALAANNTFTFTGDFQIDLVDFLEKLDDADIDDSICTSGEREDLIRALKAAIVFRNGNSSEDANGLAFTFPYKDIYYYGDEEKELRVLSEDKQRSLLSDIFSIIAVQKRKALDDPEMTLFQLILSEDLDDYTEEDWYVEGFEDYDTTAMLVDIPLTETDDGYAIQLPEKTWKIIADCQTLAYMETEDGLRRYLGSDHIGGEDANGHPTVDMNDTWITIDGQFVCYESKTLRETAEGDVYTGDVQALLNDDEEIVLHVEWDPETPDRTEPIYGHVTGFDYVDNSFAFMEKGSEKLEPGDRIEFLFDCYDEQGNYVDTEIYGKAVTVKTMERLKATDTPLPAGAYSFLGRLTDVYQRDMLTETVDWQLED